MQAREAIQDSACPVGRAIVDDDHLERRIVEPKHRRQRRLYPTSLVAGGRDDRHQRAVL